MSKRPDAAALRAAILAAEDRPLMGPISVPEWGVEVFLRELSAEERFSVSRAMDEDDETDPSVVLLTHAMVDADRVRLFQDGDAPALAAKNGSVLLRLMQEMSRRSALGQEALDRAKKPSAPTPA